MESLSEPLSKPMVTNPKNTSQDGVLESFLANWRTRLIRPYVKGKRVLDFGCGDHLTTLKGIAPLIKKGFGYDILFQNLPPQPALDFVLYGSLFDIKEQIDCVTSLACFEHLEPHELTRVLLDLHKITGPKAQIVGTVPRPPAKPVLEFLSYRLSLIDKSQILDHKVYYDKKSLKEALKGTGWQLSVYKTFQFRMNSFFMMTKG